jgi:hypothetical protein
MIPAGAAFGGLVVYTIYRLMRDPDILSARGVSFVLLALLGLAFVSCAVPVLWRCAWVFTFTPTRFIARNRLLRRRVDVPWEAIVRVRKIPRSWWNGRGGVGFSEIETADGQRVQFGTHLMWYRRFLTELKARAVRCRSFEPYQNDWDR